MGLILVDTSIWVDHLNHGDPALTALLRAKRCPLHTFVMGEISLGSLPRWHEQVEALSRIRSAEPLPVGTFMALLAQLKLQGSRLGFVDAHLLAWTVAAPDRSLWSRDRRLRERAEAAGVAWSPPD